MALTLQVAGAAGRDSILHSPLLRREHGPRSKVRWHLNARLTRFPGLLAALRAPLTIVDAYGAPGDTLLTASICRQLRERYPSLSLNCLTTNPDLLIHNPNLTSVNAPETFFSVWSWYPQTAARRDGATNILAETFARLGIGPVLGERQGDWLDLTAGAEIDRGRHAWFVDVINLLDTAGNRFALGSPFTLVNGRQVTPMRPRTIRIGWQLRF